MNVDFWNKKYIVKISGYTIDMLIECLKELSNYIRENLQPDRLEGVRICPQARKQHFSDKNTSAPCPTTGWSKVSWAICSRCVHPVTFQNSRSRLLHGWPYAHIRHGMHNQIVMLLRAYTDVHTHPCVYMRIRLYMDKPTYTKSAYVLKLAEPIIMQAVVCAHGPCRLRPADEHGSARCKRVLART